MMPTLDARLAKIEQRTLAGDQRRAQIESDAEEVLGRLVRLAATFHDEDADLDPPARDGWSPAQRVAWASRFAPDRVQPLLQEHVG